MVKFMKSIAFAALALMLLGVLTPKADALLPEENYKFETFDGSSAQAGVSSNIVAGNRVFGFLCGDSAAGSCSIFDSASGGLSTVSTSFGEIPVAAGDPAPVWLPLPVKLQTGLSYILENATGRLTVYYR